MKPASRLVTFFIAALLNVFVLRPKLHECCPVVVAAILFNVCARRHHLHVHCLDARRSGDMVSRRTGDDEFHSLSCSYWDGALYDLLYSRRRLIHRRDPIRSSPRSMRSFILCSLSQAM